MGRRDVSFVAMAASEGRRREEEGGMVKGREHQRGKGRKTKCDKTSGEMLGRRCVRTHKAAGRAARNVLTRLKSHMVLAPPPRLEFMNAQPWSGRKDRLQLATKEPTPALRVSITIGKAFLFRVFGH